MDRTLGPYFGTIGGMGTWLALVLKVSFALIGMGAYIGLFLPDLQIKPIAISLAVLLGMLNLLGAKKSGSFQVVLVIGLLTILTVFILEGIPEINFESFRGIVDIEFKSILATAGLVYISYVGVTNVASLSEEVENPEKNLPRGVILALATAILIYVLGTAVMVGVIPSDILAGDLTPAATAAGKILGQTGVIIISVAAIIAFISVANAGTLSASRYPLAMSRDHLLPRILQKLSKKNSPFISVILTVGVIVALIVFLDPTGIAKLASAFQLLMFAFVCLAVIVMRESRIESYDPGYHSPLYPWMQLFGIISSLILIFEMGLLPILFTSGLILIGSLWYFNYGRKHVIRTGAIYHIFERLGKSRYAGLDRELRGILKEKGLRQEDPFDDIVTRSIVLDLNKESYFEEVIDELSQKLSAVIHHTPEEIKEQILEGTRVGATPVTHGVALPHFRSAKIDMSHLVLVRSKPGVKITLIDPLTHEEEEEQTVFALFFLVSPESNPSQHLRILAQIAGRVDDDSFAIEWNSANNEQELKEALLHDERFLSIIVSHLSKSMFMIDKPLFKIDMPKGCLVALLSREAETIVPNGSTVIKDGDKLTIIGEPSSIAILRQQLFEEREPLTE